MESNSLSRLQMTLQQKQAEDQQRFENQTEQALIEHGQRLSELSRAELRVLEARIDELNDRIIRQMEGATQPLRKSLNRIRREAQHLNRMILKAWIRPALIGLSLFFGIFAGSWVLTAYLSNSIRGLLETQAAFTQQIEQQRETLAAIQAQTGGIDILTIPEGRFLVYPVGLDPDRRLWEIDGRPAILLPN